MTGFIYFLPNINDLSLEDLKKSPVAYAFEKKDPICKSVCANGPGGLNGVIFASGVRLIAARTRFEAKNQTWFNCGTHWIGYWNDAVPGPDDLARKEQLPGEWLELNDENDWLIPVARRWSMDESAEAMQWETVLPRGLELQGDKVFNGGVVRRYQHLWQIANAIYNVRHDGETVTEFISTEAERELMKDGSRQVLCAVQAIQSNYVVGPVECLNILRLFETDTPMLVFDILTDWSNYETILKKKQASDGPPSLNGQEAGSQGIDQPSSTVPA